MRKFFFVTTITLFCSIFTCAQVRPVEKETAPVETRKSDAPPSFSAKYEGGMFGFNDKEQGTVKFDDANQRIVFYGKDQKEKFSIPYNAMLVIYPQSKSVTSNTGNVVRNIPLPGAVLGGFIKEKRRYLVLHFDDIDVDAKGVVNFKLDSKELLDSVIQALGEKAELKQRGDAYYRPRVIRKQEI